MTATLYAFPAPAPEPPAKVSAWRRNRRAAEAVAELRACSRLHLLDGTTIGYLIARVDRAHHHRHGWQEGCREGLLQLCLHGQNLDREACRHIADGLEEDYVHSEDWYEAVFDLVDLGARLRAVSADPAEADLEVDDPHSGTRWERAAVARLSSDVDDTLARLLTPAGGGRP
jgi:hypothetical protein